MDTSINFLITSGITTGFCLFVAASYNHPFLVTLFMIIVVFSSRHWNIFFKRRLASTNKYIIITGCDSGFGHGLAQSLDRAGCRVLAGCLYPQRSGAMDLKQSSSDRLRVLHLDVSCDESVQSFAAEVQNITGDDGLWGLVNNAGIQFFGEIECLTMDFFRKNMEVNYFGIVRMCKTFIPLLRRSQGRIVNVTSVLGLYTVKYRGTYSPTKYATETFSDILRRELKKFKIAVSIVEPGDFGDVTNVQQYERIKSQNEELWNNCSEETRKFYTETYVKTVGLKSCFNQQKAERNSTKYVIQAIEDALFSTRPHIRYLVDGRGNCLDMYTWAARLAPFIPDSLMDFLVEEYL